MTADISKWRSLDTETRLFRPGESAPPFVCASVAWPCAVTPPKGRLVPNAEVYSTFKNWLDEEKHTIAYANAAYDLAVLGERNQSLLSSIFHAIREGRVHDVLIAQALDAIYHGTLGIDPRTGGELRSPSTRKPSKRYSLEVVTDLVLGRIDAKTNDVWRKSYALLEGIPIERWPAEAQQYPVDDAVNTLEIALAQVFGSSGKHASIAATVNGSVVVVCEYCREESGSITSGDCHKAPRIPPHQNLYNLPQQVEAAFALHLGAAWGLRTDGARVEKLAAEVEEKHRISVERYQKKGWIREDGTEDQAAIKKAVANAYGASGECPRCEGSGKVRNVTMIECRGEKIGGRYKGCKIAECTTCGGMCRIQKLGNEVTCKNVLDENDAIIEAGCDGTGLDLSTCPMLPRSDKGGVKTDRDSKMESGDDDLSDFGEDTSEKLRSTYVPWLRKGVHAPISLSPNVLLYTGRTSYDGPIQQMPRKGGARECVVARNGYVLCSTDYAAGELCTLSQYTKWVVGESQMLNIINATKDPGALHTMLGAQMLGIDFAEMQVRIDAKDKQAKEFRQAAKCFHPDTEILTRNRGWTKISELTMDDEVASVVPHQERPDPIGRQRDSLGRFPPASDGHTRNWWQQQKNKIEKPTMEIVWTKPLRLTTRKATEGLLHLKNESIDLRVTPDHSMLAYGSTKLLRTVEAKDFGKQRGWFNAAIWKGGELEVDERLLRLSVAVQADGTYSIPKRGRPRIKLGFSKKRKIERLKGLLQLGEYSTGVARNGKHKPTTWFNLTEDLSDKIKKLLDPDKTIPWSWLELTPALRNVVLDEVAFWDSHIVRRCYNFSTTTKKNTEVLQAMASITNRKATYVDCREPEKENHNQSYLLSVKDKYETRGGNLKTTKLDYDDDVFCLTVPSGCVLVRDGGIPVITRQCANFGYPGGLGAVTLVLTNRRAAAGETQLPDGNIVAGIRLCILLGGAERCGIEKITKWKDRQCSPVCKACVDIAESVLKKTFFKTYPEVRAYLDWVAAYVEQNGNIPQIAWNPERGETEVLRTRGGVTFCDAANQGFQGLLSDIGKRALCTITRECYLGVKDDGSPSPLAGSRVPVWLHDEPLAELLAERAHEAGPRIAEIMMQSGRDLAPEVYWKAEPALMTNWDKNAEPNYVDGKLALWTPKVAA